jgi:Sulfotransferase domain
MIYGIRATAKYLLGTDQAGRNFRIYSDDTFIVSYARSGNLWTRFLVANLVHPDTEVRLSNIEQLVPDTCNQSNRALKRIPRPRFIKSHQYFDHRYKKIIHVVRDPRDVVLSYFHFQRKYRHIADDYPLDCYVDDFLHGRLGSDDWGTWKENVASWIMTRGDDSGFLGLRYEDMIENPQREVGRIAAFLGVEASPARLDQVIALSSGNHLKKLEKQDADQWVGTKGRRQDIPMVRLATSGGWKKDLPPESVAKIEAAWGGLMSTLGYELTTVPAPSTSSEEFCGAQSR